MITTLVLASTLWAGSCALETNQTNALIAEAIADSQSRSSLLLSNDNSGHDGGFFIASKDGAFGLNISGQIQTRWNALWRDDDGVVDPFRSGFQMRRVKFSFEGHVFDESLRFKITNELRRAGGGSRISDAFIEKRFDNGLAIQAGQFTLPFTREDLDSSKRQLAVDRSLVNGVFRLERSQGVQLSIRDEQWSVWAAFSDGFRSPNIDFGTDATDWALTGRVEWLPVGSFGVFKSQVGAVDAETSLRFGGAVHAEERGASVFGPGGRLVTWTGDVTAASAGWIGFATFTGRENSQATGTTNTDWGVSAQLGIWATDDIVPFVRWEILIPDSDRLERSKTNILTSGANWYLHGEAIKLTVDGVWLIDGAGSNDLVGVSTGVGLLNPGLGDSAFLLRAQVQVLF